MWIESNLFRWGIKGKVKEKIEVLEGSCRTKEIVRKRREKECRRNS